MASTEIIDRLDILEADNIKIKQILKQLKYESDIKNDIVQAKTNEAIFEDS